MNQRRLIKESDRPGAHGYSLGKVIYFMLSGGTVLPRERLHDAEYSSVFARAGERQRLLQVMLAKMICPLPARMQTMDEVLREIERIDTWSRQARVLPISTNALAGLEALQERSLEKQRAFEENMAAKARRDSAINNAKYGSLGWIKAELEKTKSLMGQGGGLSSGIRDVTESNDVPRINHLLPNAAVELWVRSAHDHFQREHILRFSFCTKFSVRVSVQVAGAAMPPEPAEPEHAEVGILPAYGQLFPEVRGQRPVWNLFTMRNQLFSPPAPGGPSVMGGRRMPMHPPQPDIQIQALTFSTAIWPQAADSFPQAFQQAVDAFVHTISQHF